jgi:hypothetical protein
MTIIIYFDSTLKNSQVIHPTKDFEGDVGGLVEALTQSSRRDGVRNFYRYEVI